jgi:hypothetical protein
MTEYKINCFQKLLDNYIIHVYDLIDNAVSLKLLSTYMIFFVPKFKNYIENNRVEVLQNCVSNIDDFIEFSFDDFNEMDDNQSFDKYMHKIQNNKTESHNSTELFNFLLEIKKKSKKLNNKSRNLIKNKINIIVNDLSDIRNVFM